ncbi:hypothetical protein PRIPAC_79351 [Pristionchus pacificus]|uniref:C3H1-type domain-containing protein n=1 Tax=Pristionchus pacificus TaxID=54126 RepID=A0A8R1V482_PRIPA|nr:hypothetical protein PRIPAC_79351 [Pristionchus pacificus]
MVDIITKTSANEAMIKQEEMEEEFEDGELVEEGEICDDDDEAPEQKPGLLKAPAPTSSHDGSPPTNNGHPASSPGAKKPSREEHSAPKNTGAESPWKPQSAAAPRSPRSQQQHQDDGFGFGDRDFRSIGSAEDRDFRWNEGPANGAGAEDFDFRDRRRRHSPSPPPHLKRARPSPPHGPFADDGGPPYMGRGGHFGGRGGFRGRGRGGGFGAPRWMERHICKFFREGYCRDGDGCSYSHSAEDSKRRPEVCKFYMSGHCKKGLACHHLHGEFPCKAFHKGECTRDPCQFSHRPLDDYTRPLYDNAMQQEQYSTRMGIPPQPLNRRRVLLPGGPVPGAPTPLMGAPVIAANPAAVAAAQAAAAIVTQGLVAPPGVTPGPFPPGYVPAGGGPHSDRDPSLPPPSVIVPRLSSNPQQQLSDGAPAAIPLPSLLQPASHPAASAPSPPAPATSAASAVAASAAAGGTGFNISMMLAQIAGTMPGADANSTPSSSYAQPPAPYMTGADDLESPESPPQTDFGAPHYAGGPMDIPLPYLHGARGGNQRSGHRPVEYRMLPVDCEPPYSGVSSAIINSSSQQSDPRIARLLASQFDAVSSMIAAQQAAAAAAPPAPPAPPRDPRARPDPRRDPRTARDTDARVSWMPQMS